MAEITIKIKSIYNFRTIGAQVRSRMQLLGDGEKNSKFFINLEKSRQNKNMITSLKTSAKKETNNELILNEITRYYKKSILRHQIKC